MVVVAFRAEHTIATIKLPTNGREAFFARGREEEGPPIGTPMMDRCEGVEVHTMTGQVYAAPAGRRDGGAPADAKVVGETWRCVTEDGRPDRRRSSNPRYPIVAYGMLAMTGLAAGAVGLGRPTRAAKSGLRLLVSNKAVVRFARAFGAGSDEEGFQDTHDTAREARARRNAEAEVERSGSLFKIVGVEPGASRAEISAAYKQKARMYHPDRWRPSPPRSARRRRSG